MTLCHNAQLQKIWALNLKLGFWEHTHCIYWVQQVQVLDKALVLGQLTACFKTELGGHSGPSCRADGGVHAEKESERVNLIF